MTNSTKLRWACACLCLAVLAGIAESAVAVRTAVEAGSLSTLWPMQIGVRVAVYAAAFVLIVLTWRGGRAARWALLILLGILGTASMVVPMVAELVAGRSLLTALGGDTSALFPALRAAHIVLVLAGSFMLLAYRPVRPGPRIHAAVS